MTCPSAEVSSFFTSAFSAKANPLVLNTYKSIHVLHGLDLAYTLPKLHPGRPGVFLWRFYMRTSVWKFAAALFVALGFTSNANAVSMLGIDPPAEVIELGDDGSEWVWAAPCAPIDPSCGVVMLHHGFTIPTVSQWLAGWTDLAELIGAFEGPQTCASPWFSTVQTIATPGTWLLEVSGVRQFRLVTLCTSIPQPLNRSCGAKLFPSRRRWPCSGSAFWPAELPAVAAAKPELIAGREVPNGAGRLHQRWRFNRECSIYLASVSILAYIFNQDLGPPLRRCDRSGARRGVEPDDGGGAPRHRHGRLHDRRRPGRGDLHGSRTDPGAAGGRAIALTWIGLEKVGGFEGLRAALPADYFRPLYPRRG